MWNKIAWIGSTLLAFCGSIEAYVAYQTEDSGLSWTFITVWGLGEVLMFTVAVFKYKKKPLIFNYGINVLFISIIGYFKWINI